MSTFDDFAEVTGETPDCELYPEDPICMALDPSQHVAAHFFLWFNTLINAGAPIIYWFIWFEPELAGSPANKAVLDTNWWWFGWAWPMMVYGHVGLYGLPFLLGFFTWSGIKGMDKFYMAWWDFPVNYLGTIMHFMTMLGLLAGAGFWKDNELITVTRAWITAGAYAGWVILNFVWQGTAKGGSYDYMYKKHCGDECLVEVEAEEDEAEEIADDATTFVQDIWQF